MKILVLGHTGMLGNAVYKHLSSIHHGVEITTHRWPKEGFIKEMLSFNGDYIVNCIGAIPQRTDDFVINYDLPIWLDKNVKGKIIHPGTDCEMDNDHYGISKVNASDYIKNDGKRTKIIKTSIIGHELKGVVSLLNWFLTSEGVVSGYTNAMWNGNTTLEWAKTCVDMMNDWEGYEIENIIRSYCISKYELLSEISEVYKGGVTQIDKNDRDMPNKCLTGGIQKNPISIQLKELKEFYGY